MCSGAPGISTQEFSLTSSIPYSEDNILGQIPETPSVLPYLTGSSDSRECPPLIHPTGSSTITREHVRDANSQPNFRPKVNQKLGVGAQHLQVLKSQTHYEGGQHFGRPLGPQDRDHPAPEDPAINTCAHKGCKLPIYRKCKASCLSSCFP